MSNYKIFKAMLNLNLSIGNTINHQLSYRKNYKAKRIKNTIFMDLMDNSQHDYYAVHKISSFIDVMSFS